MEQFRKRITELADRAYSRDIVMFSDFLDLNQQNCLHGIRWSDHGVRLSTWGGYEFAERQMAAFVPDAFSCQEISFPVCTVRIAPAAPRFAEKLNHRDFLGSVLALGIDRSRIGDLLVKENEAILICENRMAAFLTEELTRVRHTEVLAKQIDVEPTDLAPETEEHVGSVASVRPDTLIALAFGMPRSKAGLLIREGAVYINSRLVTSNGHPVREGDRISVRGVGKCRFARVLNTTKKGRIMVCVERFI